MIQRIIHTPRTVAVRENSDGTPSRTIEGYAIVFDTPSVDMSLYEDEVIREIISRDAVSQELLDTSDIKMTMFHDRQLILARACGGKKKRTLEYGIDDMGVWFRFDAPNTTDGDKALELVKRGDIDGCSFAFSTNYSNGDFVSETAYTDEKNRKCRTFTVKRMTGIYDFTLAADPAYPSTTVATQQREIIRKRDEEKEDTSYLKDIEEINNQINK